MSLNPEDCFTPETLLAGARQQHRGHLMELNGPATIIQEVEVAQLEREGFPTSCARLAQGLESCARSAEEVMMQLGFLSLGINPTFSFNVQAFDAGWRYRIDKGFHRIPTQTKKEF